MERPIGSRFPVRPTDEYLDELASEGQSGSIAAGAIAEAWERIDELEAELTRVIESDSAARSALAPVALAEGFDPRGDFVYLLYGADHARPIYIGMSRNLLSRLGNHLGAPDRRHLIERVAVIRCSSREDAARLERDMITHHQPPMNVVGIERAS